MGIRDDLLKAQKSGEVTLMILADFSKAFDTLNFKAALCKLHKFGFSDNFLYWMVSYLTDRYQYVQLDDQQSTLVETHFGVPQGSVLGPFIFNLCIRPEYTLYVLSVY